MRAADLRPLQVGAHMVCRMARTHSHYHLCAGGTQYQRLSGSLLEGTDRDEQMPWTFNPIRYFWWLASWMIPGGGMFLEAYFIFRCVRRPARRQGLQYLSASPPPIVVCHLVRVSGLPSSGLRN